MLHERPDRASACWKRGHDWYFGNYAWRWRHLGIQWVWSFAAASM